MSISTIWRQRYDDNEDLTEKIYQLFDIANQVMND